MKRRMHGCVVVTLALIAVAGCGSSSATNADSGSAGTSGAAGSGGSVGSGGHAGGTAGADAGAAGSGGSNGACAVPQRTTAPTTCEDFDVTGAWITAASGMYDGNGGIIDHTGQHVLPQGGTLADGDYDLVAADWGASGGNITRRTIRVFDSGNYFDWSVDNEDPSGDAGVTHFRIDSAVTVSGTNLQMVMPITCSGMINSSLGYTVNGDELLLFNFNASALFTYQRTCAR
jgi:hypothetical protein